MPFEIIQMDGVTVIRVTGRITGSDLVNAAYAVVDHPAFEPDWPRIWDCRGVTQILLDIDTAREIRTISEERIQQPGDDTGRTAVVVEREIDRDVAEFVRWYLKGRSLRVFESMDEARAWVLGA